MAERKTTKKTTGSGRQKKSQTGRKPAAKNGTKRTTTKINYSQKQLENTLLDEIILIVIMVLSVFVMISLISQSAGFLGAAISSFLKGLFGFGAYCIPLLVIGDCLWMLLSKDRAFQGFKIAGGVLFVLAVSVFFHVLKDTGGATTFASLYQNGSGQNGGAIGGILGNLLVKGVDKIGAYLIVIAALVASVILATGLSFITGIRNTYSYAKGRREYRSEKMRQRADYLRIAEEQNRQKTQQRLKRYEQRLDRKLERQLNHKGLLNIDLSQDMPQEMKKKGQNELEQGEALEYVDMTAVKEKRAAFMKQVEEENLKRQREEMAQMAQEKESAVTEERPQKKADSELSEEVPIVYLKSALEADAQEETFSPDNKEESENTVDTDAILSAATKVGTLYLETPLEESPLPDKNTEEPLIQEESSIVTDYEDHETDKTQYESYEEIEALSDEEKEEPDKEETEAVSLEPVVQPQAAKPVYQYQFPPLDLLKKDKGGMGGTREEMLSNARKLEETLKSFGVDARVIQISQGPTVTRYELSPSQGVKVSKIVNLADDIALNLAAAGIRIEAPIPGKAAVGIEVPNREPQSVGLRTVLESEAFQTFPSKLAFALGEDIAGNPVVTDIAKMPHLLIAGATGSGKSVCINTLIASILYKAKPEEVKLLLVDPKVVELSVYNGIPHLLIPVVTDPKKAAGALNWAVREMLSRYNDFAEHNVRDITGFNAMKRELGQEEGCMPQIVIIIDELADLMMAAPGEVEDAICRLAQMARAAGLHLIIATQRPSVDVITGVIKANIPSRLAFAVSSGVDSRTILDMTGAEKLLGKGDMLFYPTGMSKPIRVQGAFISDKEVEKIVDFVRQEKDPTEEKALLEQITASGKTAQSNEEADAFLDQAIELVVKKEKASVSMLQRQFRIGYNRAARLMEDLENRGIVGPEDGSKPRKVLMSMEELEEWKEQGGMLG